MFYCIVIKKSLLEAVKVKLADTFGSFRSQTKSVTASFIGFPICVSYEKVWRQGWSVTHRKHYNCFWPGLWPRLSWWTLWRFCYLVGWGYPFRTPHHLDSLTLLSLVMPNGYTSKSSRPYWSNAPFLIYWYSGTLVLRTGVKLWVRPVWGWTLWYSFLPQ